MALLSQKIQRTTRLFSSVRFSRSSDAQFVPHRKCRTTRFEDSQGGVSFDSNKVCRFHFPTIFSFFIRLFWKKVLKKFNFRKFQKKFSEKLLIKNLPKLTTSLSWSSVVDSTWILRNDWADPRPKIELGSAWTSASRVSGLIWQKSRPKPMHVVRASSVDWSCPQRQLLPVELMVGILLEVEQTDRHFTFFYFLLL